MRAFVVYKQIKRRHSDRVKNMALPGSGLPPKDIKPYMDVKFEKNILLTETATLP